MNILYRSQATWEPQSRIPREVPALGIRYGWDDDPPRRGAAGRSRRPAGRRQELSHRGKSRGRGHPGSPHLGRGYSRGGRANTVHRGAAGSRAGRRPPRGGHGGRVADGREGLRRTQDDRRGDIFCF